MNSLQFSADLGAPDVGHHFIGLRVQICEIFVEPVDCDLPGRLRLIVRQDSGMAAWFGQRQTSKILISETFRWEIKQDGRRFMDKTTRDKGLRSLETTKETVRRRYCSHVVKLLFLPLYYSLYYH